MNLVVKNFTLKLNFAVPIIFLSIYLNIKNKTIMTSIQQGRYSHWNYPDKFCALSCLLRNIVITYLLSDNRYS